MKAGTYLGDGRLVVGVSLLLLAYGNDGHRETGRLMTTTVIGTGVTVWGMKEIIGRKRPLSDVVGSPAFPSGTRHTLSPVQRSLGRGIPNFVFRSTSVRGWSVYPGFIWVGTMRPMLLPAQRLAQ